MTSDVDRPPAGVCSRRVGVGPPPQRGTTGLQMLDHGPHAAFTDRRKSCNHAEVRFGDACVVTLSFNG